MHEIGAARDYFELIQKEAEKAGMTTISRVVLRVGEAAALDADLLRHSLEDHVFPGTAAEGAELVIKSEPFRAGCRTCGRDFKEGDAYTLNCPRCGSFDIQIKSGSAVYLDRLEGERNP